MRKCPYPIEGDDGSAAQCIANSHCGCNEKIIDELDTLSSDMKHGLEPSNPALLEAVQRALQPSR